MPVNFRYRKVGYVALNVTDVARTTEFATKTFALENTGQGPNGERFLSCGPEHHDVVLYPAKDPGLLRGAFELETPEDVERAHAHFETLGLKPTWLAQEEKEVLGLGVWPVFRVRDPVVGMCFEYYSKMMFRARARAQGPTNFKHLGHFGINVPNVREATEFAVKNMGFLPSDILGHYVGTLMRAFPNPNHHSFAYLPARDGKKQFNHVAFMVESIDDIGKLFNRIEAHNVGRAFGIGRHPTSGSIHLYIFDPDQLVWEYTLGMEQFPEHGAREPRFMSAAPEDYDVWDAKPKPGFGGSGNVVTQDEPARMQKIA
ncbi:MAG TPA: VOC family protein [Steroidobacteraceae bacterium]|nr:VOC family protein [Steroidobacteraceae bacterium]